MDSKRVKRNTAKPVAIVATGVLSVLFSVVCTYAQGTANPDEGGSAGTNYDSERLFDVVRLRYTTPIGVRGEYQSHPGSRIQPNSSAFGIPMENRRFGVSRQPPPQASRERSTRRKFFGGIVGGVGGFCGGMFLGAAIEGDRCDCDDPGLVGALIGAPVGGVGVGILGYKFLF